MKEKDLRKATESNKRNSKELEIIQREKNLNELTFNTFRQLRTCCNLEIKACATERRKI